VSAEPAALVISADRVSRRENVEPQMQTPLKKKRKKKKRKEKKEKGKKKKEKGKKKKEN
jgi:hypothetical protein